MEQKLLLEQTDQPVLVMMVGLAGSGKSTIAQNIVIQMPDGTELRPIIHSSDAARLELYGNEQDQEHNSEVFLTLKKRIKEDLRNQKSVVFDATHLSKKQRAAFLSELNRIPCHKTCVCVMTPYETCLQHNGNRKRQVPEAAIKRMYMNWTPPHYHEGFDDVVLSFDFDNKEDSFDTNKLFERLNDIDQENSHHTYTIGDHCIAAFDYVREKDPHNRILQAATLLHDIGKEFTKTRINSSGVEDGECHYYQHQCVGAYDAMFHLKQNGFSDVEILDAANLIYYHMHPYMAWEQSEKAIKRDKRMIGEAMFKNVMLLHEADAHAHGPIQTIEHTTHEGGIEIER